MFLILLILKFSGPLQRCWQNVAEFTQSTQEREGAREVIKVSSLQIWSTSTSQLTRNLQTRPGIGKLWSVCHSQKPWPIEGRPKALKAIVQSVQSYILRPWGGARWQQQWRVFSRANASRSRSFPSGCRRHRFAVPKWRCLQTVYQIFPSLGGVQDDMSKRWCLSRKAGSWKYKDSRTPYARPKQLPLNAQTCPNFSQRINELFLAIQLQFVSVCVRWSQAWCSIAALCKALATTSLTSFLWFPSWSFPIFFGWRLNITFSSLGSVSI